MLLNADGSVTLADFGVSAASHRSVGSQINLGRAGQRVMRDSCVGTPCWMAPEVLGQAGR